MLRFITVRLGLIIITLFVVSAVIFAVTEALPGDAAKIMLGRNATERNLETKREELGLNRPAPVRYGDWIFSAIQGDFGESLIQKRPVTEIIGHRFLPSIYLAVFAFVIAVPPAVIIGTMAGVRPNSIGDRVVSTVGMVGISLPEFVTGLFLIVIFSSELGWLPTTSAIPRGESPLTKPDILVLPTLTLTGVVFAYIMRMTRANVMEVMETHYVRTAILKGLPMRQVILRHVLPNSMLPTITVIATNFGWMLGGLIIVENVFAYPGLGQLLLRSMVTRDVPLLEALTLLVAGTYAISNLLADLSYAVLDPRIRLA